MPASFFQLPWKTENNERNERMELREKELACEIVRDLLPLYVDGMVSDVSKKSIDNHLEYCTECSEIYHDMACHLEMETTAFILFTG